MCVIVGKGETCAGALGGMIANSVGDCPFTFWTDKLLEAHFSVDVPSSFRSLLGGVSGSFAAGILVEVIATCIFVMAILGVTSKKQSHGSFGGLIIGLTLTLVHIFGIGLTGTSVNPARSLGPAILAGGDALSDLWVFIVGPWLQV